MDKFLIIRLGALGDVIHGIPAAAALRRCYPQVHIDWIVEPQYVELLELVECVDHVIPFDPRQVSSGRTLSTVAKLRRARYDAVIDLQGLLKSAVLARLAGARRTIGFPRRYLREPLARFLYSDTPDPGAASHIIGRNVALLAPLDVSDRRVRFPIRIPHTAAVESVTRRFASARYAIVNPGAAWPNKRWPPDRFGAVAAALHRQMGLRSVVLWGPGEQPLAEAVAAASDDAAELAPPTTIADIVGIARAAELMISGDTGPLHVAGAVGTPIVALFGPTRPERNGPWSPRDISVSRTQECDCLYERRCRRAVPCIENIGIDEVIAAVRSRLTAHG